jgi:peroxiredoxin
MIAEGQEAPGCELKSDSGETVRPTELRGKPVVLYFYPRDGKGAGVDFPASR